MALSQSARMLLFSNNIQDTTQRCRSFVIWCCVVMRVVSTFQRTVAHYNPIKCQELLVQGHSVTFQKTWMAATLLLKPQISQGNRWTWNIQVINCIKHSWCQKAHVLPSWLPASVGWFLAQLRQPSDSTAWLPLPQLWTSLLADQRFPLTVATQKCVLITQ
jgi:hypothetical protein